MTKYPSKLGIGITIFTLSVIVGSSLFMILDGALLAVIINISVLLLVYILYKSTNYIIEGSILRIKSGFLINKKLSIKDISKIIETNTMISAPAFSLDRLEIKYGRNSIIISPVKKVEFIKQLMTINPKIEVIYKTK